jgi:hypothetical protein
MQSQVKSKLIGSRELNGVFWTAGQWNPFSGSKERVEFVYHVSSKKRLRIIPAMEEWLCHNNLCCRHKTTCSQVNTVLLGG